MSQQYNNFTHIFLKTRFRDPRFVISDSQHRGRHYLEGVMEKMAADVVSISGHGIYPRFFTVRCRKHTMNVEHSSRCF